MKIKYIMNTDLQIISPESTVKDAAVIMSDMKIGAILIGNGKSDIKGIISERDIMNKVVAKSLNPESISVSDIMTKNVITINQELEEKDALRLMEDKSIRHLPVIALSGNCAGMLSVRDIMHALLTALEDENQTLSQYIMADGPGG